MLALVFCHYMPKVKIRTEVTSNWNATRYEVIKAYDSEDFAPWNWLIVNVCSYSVIYITIA
jgi:hypothetical protein